MIEKLPMKVDRALNYRGSKLVVENDDISGAAFFTGEKRRKPQAPWRKSGGAGIVDQHFTRRSTPKHPFGS